MSRVNWFLVAIVICALLLSSCGQQGDGLDLEGSNWILVDMAGETPIPGSGITLGFDNGQVRGHLSCNSFSGPYSLSGNSLEFGLLMTTLMACVDDALMQQESRMSELIGQVERAQIIDGRLQLVLADGNELIYEPME